MAHDLINLPGKYRLHVEDYQLLDESGAFEQFAKTELIEGEIIAVRSQYGPHSRVQTRLLVALSAACDRIGDIVEPWAELSIAISPDTMLQPDIVITHGVPGSGALPTAQVAVIVEITDTTARVDLGAKARICASANIPEYWVADVNGRVIHQMWASDGDTYLERRALQFGTIVSAVTIAGLAVETIGL